MPNMGMFGGFNMMGNDISNRQKVKKKKEDNNKPQTLTFCIYNTPFRIHLCQQLYCSHYDLSDNAWCCARPSGTEPKIKFYMGVKGSSIEDAAAKEEALKKAVMELVGQ